MLSNKKIKTYKFHSGFAHLELIVILLVIGSISVIGVKLFGSSFAAVETVSVIASTGAGVEVPITGVYWGGTNAGDDKIVSGCEQTKGFDLLECKVGWAGASQGLGTTTAYNSSMQHFFTDCNDSITGQLNASAKETGRKVLLVNMKCGNWSALANGNEALVTNLRERAREIAALNIPVILTYHHEPENDSCGFDPGEGYFGTPEEYRAAYRKFASIVRDQAIASESNKIATGWTLMGYTFSVGGTQLWDGSCDGHNRSDKMIRNPDNWYPGDDAVDWIMPDVYDNDGLRSFATIVDQFYAWTNTCPAQSARPLTNYNCSSAKYSKPVGLAETSVQGTVDHRVNFFNDMLTTLPNYPKFKAYAFWSSAGVTSTLFDGRVDREDDPTHRVLKAFARVELSPYVRNITFDGSNQVSVNAAPVVNIVSPATGFVTTASKSREVVANATDDKAIVKVEFLIDGNLISTDTTSAPYSADWGSVNPAPGQHVLTARAYDSQGKATTSAGVTVTVQQVIQTNNTQTGSANFKFNFSNGWKLGEPKTTFNAYKADSHNTNAANAMYTFAFTGIRVKVYAERNIGIGISAISIDGGPEIKVDGYAASRTDNVLVYTSPVLAQKAHTIKVRNTGTKNAASQNTYLVADRIEVVTQ